MEDLPTPAELAQHRDRFVEAMRAWYAEGKPLGKWTIPYLLRHTAYHVLDHTWEMRARDLHTSPRHDSTKCPVIGFEDESSLRAWLAADHRESKGLWVRIFKSGAGIRSVTFEDLLEQGLCFGWSEKKACEATRTFFLSNG